MFQCRSFTDVYAKYLRKYLEAYRTEGIRIDDYILPQNEPLHSANGYPTMSLSPQAEAKLVASLAKVHKLTWIAHPETKMDIAGNSRRWSGHRDHHLRPQLGQP
jgi:O-glycosyl hydrolase